MGQPARKTKTERTVRVVDIVGMNEIGERTGTNARVVWNHTRRYDEFPQPITRVSNTPLWDWAEVSEFYDKWVPSKGGWHTHKAQREESAGTSRRRRPVRVQ